MLLPIPLDQGGLIPKQTCSLAGSDSDGVARKTDSKHDVLVRVYRPGYRTIEIRPGEESRAWRWTPADFAGQEKVIDDLLGVRSVPGQAGWWEFIALAPHTELAGSSWPTGSHTLGDWGLLPGSVSARHREVLLFAAGEYQRLAKNAAANSPDMEEVSHRLEGKAAQLRRYADALTTEEFYRKQSIPYR